MHASPRSLARDAVDLVTGRRPEVRNRVKFFLLSPIYDGFYRCLGLDPHRAIEAKLAPGTRRVLDICTGTALVPAVVAAARPTCLVVGLDLSPEMLAVGRHKIARLRLGNAPLVRVDPGRLPFSDACLRRGHRVVRCTSYRRPFASARSARLHASYGRKAASSPPISTALRGWVVDLYLRLGEPANARAVLGDGLARLMRSAGFAVEREGPRGRVPMQLLVTRRTPR
jgi:SAM-dependent methyltransferase